MSHCPRRLSLRLALMFALVSMLVLGLLGTYLYHSLARELAWRDDQALLGRLQRMQALLADSAGIQALQQRPALYENMLGNRDSLLWLLDAQGQALISINPSNAQLPALPASSQPRLTDAADHEGLRLAWQTLDSPQGPLTLIAGRSLAERQQMLASYRLRLWLALAACGLLAFALGGWVSARGLRPVRQLAQQAASIGVRTLDARLDEQQPVQELAQLSQALNQMLARLEQGFAQLSRFSEDLAHEMRTPLSNLMGQTQQALRHSRSVSDYQDVLVSNQEEYERLSRMIDSMLFLARCEQPQASIARQTVDLAALLAQLFDYFEDVAEERQLRLSQQGSGTLQADPQLLRRALANLLANALRHATPGSCIQVSSLQDSQHCTISVHNQGQAIAAEHLPYLFERFYRCDPSRQQSGDSGGLGLAIVRSIMHLHGGQVSVHSDAQGTCFSLHFPTPA